MPTQLPLPTHQPSTRTAGSVRVRRQPLTTDLEVRHFAKPKKHIHMRIPNTSGYSWPHPIPHTLTPAPSFPTMVPKMSAYISTENGNRGVPMCISPFTSSADVFSLLSATSNPNIPTTTISNPAAETKTSVFHHPHFSKPACCSESNTTHASATVMDSFDLPAVPFAIQITLFVCISLGFVWACLVYLVSCRARGQTSLADHRDTQRKKRGQDRWWRRWLGLKWLTAREKDRGKPVDKPSRWAHMASSSGDRRSDEAELATGVLTGDIQSLRRRRKSKTSIELQEFHIDLDQQPGTPFMPPWRKSQHSNQPQGQHHKHLQPSLARPNPDKTPVLYLTPCNAQDAPLSSPDNPYLPNPPLRSRSSAEYLSAHTAFFASPEPNRDSMRPAYVSPTVLSASSSHCSFGDVDALEAQTSLPTRHREDPTSELLSDQAKRWSTGMLLDTVEETVNRAVGKLIRWAGDDGSDEALLLPFGNGDR